MRANKEHVKDWLGTPNFWLGKPYSDTLSFYHEFKETTLFKIYDDRTVDAYNKVVFTLKREHESDPSHNYSYPGAAAESAPIAVNKDRVFTAYERGHFLQNEDVFVLMKPVSEVPMKN